MIQIVATHSLHNSEPLLDAMEGLKCACLRRCAEKLHLECEIDYSPIGKHFIVECEKWVSPCEDGYHGDQVYSLLIELDRLGCYDLHVFLDGDEHSREFFEQTFGNKFRLCKGHGGYLKDKSNDPIQ